MRYENKPGIGLEHLVRSRILRSVDKTRIGPKAWDSTKLLGYPEKAEIALEDLVSKG